MTESHDRRIKNFTDHIRHIDSLALVVLKGHLVLEEQLERILSAFVFHPEYIDDANLRFGQKVAIARCLALDEQENTIWELLLAINGLRNELAHSLHSEKRQGKFNRLKVLFMAETSLTETEEISSLDHELAAEAIALTLGFLVSFEEEVNRFRYWVNIIDREVNPHRHESKSIGNQVK